VATSNLVYVSGALSDVPEASRQQYLEFYEEIGHLVESLGLSAYVPHRNTDPVKHKDVTTHQVDFIDRTAVNSSFLVVAVADNPSLGVGIEVEMAHHASKPVVLICHKDKIEQRRISRLIRGNPAVVHEIVYDGQADALVQLKTCLTLIVEALENSVLPDSLVPKRTS
jgi:hypothetical protein